MTRLSAGVLTVDISILSPPADGTWLRTLSSFPPLHMIGSKISSPRSHSILPDKMSRGHALTRRPLICVIGSINVDFTTVTPRFPRPGETLTATSLSINAGGKGANQAVACGRASFTRKELQDVGVAMVGAVGENDPYYGSLIRPTLREAGVDTSGINEVKGCQTGTATIIVDDGAGGENRILVVPGANHEGMRDRDHICKQALQYPQPVAIVMQGEIPEETVFAILDRCTESHMKVPLPLVIFNPAPVFASGVPIERLRKVDVLIMNETELFDLAQSLDLRSARSLAKEEGHALSEAALDQVADEFHEIGTASVVVTLGARGVYYSTSQSRIHTERGLVAGMKVDQVVDTTAAGDTFVGFFAVTLVKSSRSQGGEGEGSIETAKVQITNSGIKEAIKTANAAAAKCVQRRGAMQSIPWGYE